MDLKQTKLKCSNHLLPQNKCYIQLSYGHVICKFNVFWILHFLCFLRAICKFIESFQCETITLRSSKKEYKSSLFVF